MIVNRDKYIKSIIFILLCVKWIYLIELNLPQLLSLKDQLRRLIWTYIDKLFPNVALVVRVGIVGVHVLDGVEDPLGVEGVVVLVDVVAHHRVEKVPRHLVVRGYCLVVVYGEKAVYDLSVFESTGWKKLTDFTRLTYFTYVPLLNPSAPRAQK